MIRLKKFAEWHYMHITFDIECGIKRGQKAMCQAYRELTEDDFIQLWYAVRDWLKLTGREYMMPAILRRSSWTSSK